jgi:hypothetical protein
LGTLGNVKMWILVVWDEVWLSSGLLSSLALLMVQVHGPCLAKWVLDRGWEKWKREVLGGARNFNSIFSPVFLVIHTICYPVTPASTHCGLPSSDFYHFLET